MNHCATSPARFDVMPASDRVTLLASARAEALALLERGVDHDVACGTAADRIGAPITLVAGYVAVALTRKETK